MEPKTELQRNAVARARRNELDTFQRALDVQWLNSRMEDGRMGRCLALIQREADMEKEFQERTDHAAIVNARAAEEINLATEVANIRREEECQLQRRHYLRERDPSLRELIKKLQAGYVCRDLQLQIKNNEYKRLQEKAEENHANTAILNARYNNQEAQEMEEMDKFRRNTEYRRDLQQQLVNREQQRKCAYEETLIEKKMLEDIMRTLADEDQREVSQKLAVRARLRREMEVSAQARAAWRRQQKQVLVLEERELEKQQAAAADRSAAIIAEREKKRLEKEELMKKITSKILADEAELKERDDIIKSLQEQEYLEKNVNDDILDKEKLERCKKSTMEALTAQMENKIKVQKEQQKTEAIFRKETEAKLAADLQKDREKAAEKRRKGKLYSQELLQQIKAKEEQAKKDKELEEERAKHVFDYIHKWEEEALKEREAIVRQHAPPLLGYLQAGVVKRSELGTVAAGARDRPDLQHLDLGALAATRRHKRYSKCNAQCRVLRQY